MSLSFASAAVECAIRSSSSDESNDSGLDFVSGEMSRLQKHVHYIAHYLLQSDHPLITVMIKVPQVKETAVSARCQKSSSENKT
ncbi:hypothetical protein Bpfe_023439 [Biomphalaria pfeifferi]|uniref:Uncharacterized protein n=1 Tax=Biomphalaria pfeifferi TaxID=112525 RepID=A0AAD8B4E1_BIOPF|nr:hypothetical protein Bpfe_023439 [Biomphalaria pfeifferi]